MSANTLPIFSKVGDVQGAAQCTAANNTADLTSGTSYLVFTADATNGGRVDEIRCKSSPANNTAASVMRVWINNGLTLATQANTFLYEEIGIQATVASAVNPMPPAVIRGPIVLPPGYRIYVTFGTAPGGSGNWVVTALGGKY